MSQCNYVMILTIVDQGFSDDVMSAARSAGATGGTVFNSRRLSSQETMQFWGLRVQEEREIVAILAEAEQRCQALKQNARTRLDQAAKRIVEGVVKG